MTLRRRVLVVSAGVLAAILVLVAVWLRESVEAPRVEAERERVLRSWHAAARLLTAEDPLLQGPAQAAVDLGELLGVRVTLVDEDGQVLGDSGVPGGDVTGMENHGGRPEIQAAWSGRVDLVERQSPTLGIPTLYAAGIVPVDGGGPLVLRVASPLEDLRGPMDGASRVLLALGVGGLLAVGLVVASGGIDGPLRRSVTGLEEGVAAATAGDADTLPPTTKPLAPELAGLGASIQRLLDEVRGRTREVARERDELLSIVDSIAEGVVALTEDARILRMNRAAVDLLEINQPAPFAPIGTLVRHPQLRDHLEEAVVLPLPPREFTVGDRNLLVSPHFLEPGGAVVTFLDVTELRRMEKIRRDFVANASHEMKTPLTAMRGFAETLLEGDPPEALRREFLGSIRTNSVRLQNLVDDLLDLSRLEAGAWPVQEEEVELADAAVEVWEELMRARRETGVDFRIEGDAVALADGQALHQVFRNLMDNALRFTPDDGSIQVRITARGPEVEVAVSDSGAGIPSSALPRIFERFYRVDPGRDRIAGGTGLGLAIVRHLVQSMGGEVGAESELGKGTTIRFTLPRVEGG